MGPHAPPLRVVRCPPRGPRPPWGGPAAGGVRPHAPPLREVRCPPRGPRPPWGGPATGGVRPHAPPLRFGRHARGPGHPKRHGGFTLVEVLVALAIMAVMAALTWRGIDGMARSQQATREHADQVLALQAGLAQWRADLDAMMVWPAPSAVPNAPANAAPAPQRSLAWDGRVLRITRVSAGDVAAGLRVVAWARRSTDGQWLRWQSAPVMSVQSWQAAWDAAARWAEAGAPANPGNANAQAVAIASVQDWQLHYFRGNAWSNPLSSPAAGSSAADTLPDALRLLLTLAPGQAINGTLTLDWVRPDFGGNAP